MALVMLISSMIRVRVTMYTFCVKPMCYLVTNHCSNGTVIQVSGRQEREKEKKRVDGHFYCKQSS